MLQVNNSQTLSVVLSQAVATSQLPIIFSYEDHNGTLTTNGSGTYTTNSNTSVPIGTPVATGYTRSVTYLSIYNADTASATITLSLNNSIVITLTLLPGYTLVYDHNFKIFDAFGVYQTGVTQNPLNNTTIQDVTPVTGQTVQSNGATLLALSPLGSLATLTINFPIAPVNGQIFTINTTQVIVSLSLNGGTTTIQLYTTPFLLNIGWIRFVFDISQNKWLSVP